MAGDVVGVAEVTDLFAFGRYGQRCDSDIQRAVRNPVQQTLKVPLLKFERQVQRGGNLPPEINADPRPLISNFIVDSQRKYTITTCSIFYQI